MKRVGVIGGGQLAWMMAGAAEKLGIELLVQTPSCDDPAVSIAAKTILATIDDATATAELAALCDVITFENEFVNLEALLELAKQGVCFRPGLDALKPLLDKYHQRCYLRELGLPTPRFATWEELGWQVGVGRSKGDTQETLPITLSVCEASAEHSAMPEALHPAPSFPIVLKTRRHGYDGQGTFIIKDAQALDETLSRLGHAPLLVEEFVPFERELAAIAARSSNGDIVVYPIVETQQEHQVCRRVFAPAAVSAAIAADVEAIAQTLLSSLDVVGLFGIELFLTADGKVLVNEIAPRTHNSGHFTLDACETSQFEQQLRAVTGLPLGSPAMTASGAVMVNLLGYEDSHSDYQEKRQRLTAIPNAHLHWYGKMESRLGRKLGHVTVLLEKGGSEMQLASAIEAIWYSD
ncbi:5-(carboxyamino)imidazole ribonucleotide synthase [Stenomitos frigidus ULC18]|uniref:N5-carboxyaminoimidazole ribonucleotide synthase n=2 Tax=Stenomitos TaxID=1844270 RepID=A0A2T1E6Y3_9CYAN|nr:5-(carboxyamino)imidazole ribonucleotide synthase [Stenomitos frigidus ULC18]